MATKKTTKKEVAAPVAAKTKPKAAPAKAAPKQKAVAEKKPVTRVEAAVRKTVKKASAAKEVRKQDIEVRAYFLALQRRESGMPAAPLDDWLAAEREFLR